LFVCILVAVLVGLVLYHGGPALLAGTKPPVKLVIYGFSTQEEVFSQQIIPAFEKEWEAKTGRNLIIENVFGPSGTLANQIVMGAPADIAIFSNAQHVAWLKVGRQVEPQTEAVVIGSTPMVIVTRPGNPSEVHDYADLAKVNLSLLHADPGRSGAGEWSVLAEYGSAYLENGDGQAAAAQLETIWHNVKAMGASARAIMTMFELGAGDALVTYEQDALLALDRGVSLEIVVPKRTIIAHHMAVIVDGNVTKSEREAAEDFIRFLRGDAGQGILTQYHMRSPQMSSVRSSLSGTPFTVEDLGGWSLAYHDLIDGLWRTTIEPQLIAEPLPIIINGEDG
jgi:sulfate transport system substrate-binding protein